MVANSDLHEIYSRGLPSSPQASLFLSTSLGGAYLLRCGLLGLWLSTRVQVRPPPPPPNAIYKLYSLVIALATNHRSTIFSQFIFNNIILISIRLLAFGKQVFRWKCFFTQVLCTINQTHKYLHLETFSLKLCLTSLFTHLKIILSQYFSFQ